MYFDVYFSTHSGLIIEFPFLTLEIAPQFVYLTLLAVIALRVRKVYFLDRKRGRK